MTAIAAEASAPPAAAVPLSQVLAAVPDGHDLVPGLQAWFEGRPYETLGYGTRTVTLQPLDDRWADRISKRYELVLVDPGAVRWQRRREVRFTGPTLDPETKAARAAYKAENQGVAFSENNRTFTDRVRSPRSGETCNRPGCQTPLHANNTSGECEACQHKCPACGATKSAQARQCRRCDGRSHRPRAAPSVRKPAVPASGGEGQAPAAPEAPAPPAPTVTLDDLPDYVGCLLAQIDRLRERIREQDARIAELERREAAWREVERRGQAVIARTSARA